MKFISLNPDYTLKPDEGRVLVMASLVGRFQLKDLEDSFTNVIHPIYAMILSFIDGREYDECVYDASTALSVPKELIENFINSLMDNSNRVYLKSKDGISAFPPYMIISQEEKKIRKRYVPETFEYTSLDLRTKRHLTPSTLTFMFNNICVTDCIYCYQDKSRKVNCTIPLPRIKELINEAYALHVNTIDVIGGEFFLYKHWKEVLAELRKFGYNPYLSTKMPLREEDIKVLSELSVCDIQVSIDTLIEEHLMQSIGIKEGYVQKMIEALECLDQYNIPVMIHTVLTRYTDSIADMESIFNVLKRFKNIKYWHVVKGDKTLYPRADYNTIEISSIALNEIIDYLNTLSEQTDIYIRTPQKREINNINKESVSNKSQAEFFNRSFCSGLFSSLYILPDGQVTMCEQLYWNKRFIIGNVIENNISEIWNSEKVKSLYYIKQSDIPEDSLCHTCSVFEECRSEKQVCYREIIKKNGADKWYYPDVNCPFNK